MGTMPQWRHQLWAWRNWGDGVTGTFTGRDLAIGALGYIEGIELRIRELEAKLAAAEAKEEEAAALVLEAVTVDGLAYSAANDEDQIEAFSRRRDWRKAARAYCDSRAAGHLRSRPAPSAPGEEKGECPVCKGDGNSREQLGPPCDHCNGTGCAGCDEDEELMREVDEFHRAKEASDGE